MSAIRIVRNRQVNNTNVSNEVGTRVYAGRAPQGPTTPYQVLRLISRPEVHTMVADLGHVDARVEVSTFASTYEDCETLAGYTRTALNDYSGTATGFTVDLIALDNERDIYEDQASSDARWVWRKDQDYLVHYEEA